MSAGIVDRVGDRLRTGGRFRIAARAMQAALVVVVGYGVLTATVGLVVNAGLAFAVTLLPAGLERAYDYEMDGSLVAWIAAAAFLHTVGALGPYEQFGWYDQVTHTLSATLVAGAGYAILSAVDSQDDGVTIPPKLHFAFVLIFVLAFGVFWEILEFASSGLAGLVGGEPVLSQYGVDDIALDLLFNAVGATLVALWGTGHFDGMSRFLTRRIDGARSE